MKNQKPIEFDIHFKYLCNCGQFHWLTYNEVSTKNFFIVCDCNKKIKIKTIASIKIRYQKLHKKTKIPKNKNIGTKNSPAKHLHNSAETEEIINSTTTTITEAAIENTLITDNNIDILLTEAQEIPKELLNSCVNLMYTFGYNRRDAHDLVKAFYIKNPVNEYKTFVNHLLASIKG